MRRFLAASFMVIGSYGAAYAADPPDLPILRGPFREPPATYRTVWQGFYLGGQAGYGASTMDFQDVSADYATTTTWPGLPGATHRSSSFGGFVGYNAQFEDVLIGIEGNYMHGVFSGASFAERVTPTTTYSSQATMSVKDFGSMRIRGGYVAGNFLPYAFAGLALGRADTSRTIFIDQNVPVDTPRTTVDSSSTKNQFVYGVSAGVGVDMMLFGGLFLRAEYEYLQFTSSTPANIHNVRGGVGYKF